MELFIILNKKTPEVFTPGEILPPPTTHSDFQWFTANIVITIFILKYNTLTQIDRFFRTG
jgi:hypothetical protein